MDPAAIATTLIGLDAIRAQSDDSPRHVRREPIGRQRLQTLRTGLATVLRSLADALDAGRREGAHSM